MKKHIKLNARSLPYAYWTEIIDPTTGMKAPGLGSNCIFRFDQPVILNAVEIDSFSGEDIRADRVAVEVFTTQAPKGNIIFDGALKWKGDKARIEFPDVTALAASIRCHWKHPVKRVSFGLHHPAQWTVPYRIFDQARWYGNYTDLPAFEPPAYPALKSGALNPKGSGNMKAWQDGMFAYFESRYFKISFSLVRPRISHVSWDALGTRPLDDNFLVNFLPYYASGPWTLDLGYATPPSLWGGRVDVEGNRVLYRDLTCREGLALDAEFELHDKGMILRLVQRCTKEQTLLEAAAWRFVWNGRQVCSLGTLAEPIRGNWRNGRTQAHGGWHCSNWGTLAFEPKAGPESVGLHTESGGYQFNMFGNRYIFSEIQVGCRAEPYGPVTLLPGTYEAALHFNVSNVEPQLRDHIPVHNGLRRAWGSAFAFRPEHGGLSGNSCSINSSNCQYMAADLAAYTASQPPVPDVMELVRYTLELALKGGPQYARQFEQAHDTAPSLVICAGRIHQVRPDSKWLKGIWSYLNQPISHILKNIDETGMCTCRLRSGNSGTYERSCNAWDTFGFGHHDGYSGALAYRALYNAAALARDTADSDLSARCIETARRLKEAYVKSLYNPTTGWLAGWRSRDGKLHDHCYVFINAMAVCFGMLEEDLARKILERLEEKREEAGHHDFRFGIAPQLMPVPRVDHYPKPSRNDNFGSICARSLRLDGQDSFGIFTNGGLTPCFAYFYLHALSKYGFTKTADQICDQMLESFERGIFEGSRTGTECFTWDGIPSGYEGTLADVDYHVLLAIAQHRGWIETLAPEWWPT